MSKLVFETHKNRLPSRIDIHSVPGEAPLWHQPLRVQYRINLAGFDHYLR